MPRGFYLQHHDMEHYASYRPPGLLPYASSSITTNDILHRYNLEPQLVTTSSLYFQQHLQYLRYAESIELTSCPLDLSKKTQISPVTPPPPCTSSLATKRSPPTTPPTQPTTTPEHTSKKSKISSPTKRTKVVRKLNFDEDKSSPVSGTIIRELGPDETLVVRKGDIDPAFNVVEVTEEAKAELAKIDNHIGDYVCRLCRELYEDAFGLAQHRCSRIVHVEYRCPECDKVFNCPANLASHRRWHKPRPGKDSGKSVSESEEDSSGEQFPCAECGKRFRRLAYLKKHQTTHQIPAIVRDERGSE